MFKKILTASSLFLTSFVAAEIVEIDQIDEVRPYITENALCLFDVDDTLIDNPSSLGSPPWRQWAKSKIPNLNTEFALYDALTLYIAKNAPYKTVEPTTARLIADLQSQGHAAFAFTARGRSEWYKTEVEGVDQFTHMQLNQVGIDFRKTHIPWKSLDEPYFYEGIIFAKHFKKGDYLKRLIQDSKYSPPLIIFVDDKPDQVQSVEEAAKELGIPCIGFWYRHSEMNRNFDPEVANLQLESLLFKNEILSDESALELVQANPKSDPQVHFIDILQRMDVKQVAPQ